MVLLGIAGLVLAGCDGRPRERSFVASHPPVDRRGPTLSLAQPDACEMSAPLHANATQTHAPAEAPSCSAPQPARRDRHAPWDDSPIVGVRAASDRATDEADYATLTAAPANSVPTNSPNIVRFPALRRNAAEAPVVTGPQPFTTGPARPPHMLPGAERSAPRSSAPASSPQATSRDVGSAAYASPPPFNGASARLSLATQQAVQHYRQGFALASRGAHFSARKEFFEALNLLVEALDAVEPDKQHAEALSAGLQALTEARDFAPHGAVTRHEVDLAMVIEGHRTPVLKGVDLSGMSPATATYRYQEYAVDRLTAALNGQQAGSMALYALGKLYSVMVDSGSSTIAGADGDAIVFHQAAMLVYPGNYLAANELGVLTARRGQYETAKVLLQQSLRMTQQPATWHNLAVVHARLGEAKLAEQARQSGQIVGGGSEPTDARALIARQAVLWVDPSTFAATSQSPGINQPAPQAPTSSLPTAPPPATGTGTATSGVMPVSHNGPVGGVNQPATAIGRFWKSGLGLTPWGSDNAAAEPTRPAAAPSNPGPNRRWNVWQQ